METNRQGLQKRTENLNQCMIEAGIHPDPETYELQLDYNAFYGGYRLVFVQKSSPFGEHSFMFSHRRMSVSEMGLYQGGIFDTLQALHVAKQKKVEA